LKQYGGTVAVRRDTDMLENFLMVLSCSREDLDRVRFIEIVRTDGLSHFSHDPDLLLGTCACWSACAVLGSFVVEPNVSSDVWFYPWNQADLADYFDAEEGRWRTSPRHHSPAPAGHSTGLGFATAGVHRHRVGRRGADDDAESLA
jgi:hypothetical protein